MKLTYQAPYFIAVSSYEERAIPKAAKFRWNPTMKRWDTTDVQTACALATYADEAARLALDAAWLQRAATAQASRALDADVAIPCPEGLSYYGFQKAGVAFMAERQAVLLGDEMGAGKTIQVCGYLNLRADIARVLVVCPASLRLNWQRELERWIVPARLLSVHIATTKESLAELETFWQGSGLRVAIVNYDILHRFEVREDSLEKKGKKKERYIFAYHDLDLLVADEAHYLQNDGARRSKAVRCIPAKNRMLLTGTPMTNRPKNLWTILNYLDPQSWPSFFKYGLEFCDGKQIEIGYGKRAWDFNGASRLQKLNDLLRSTVMIRRLKKDVLHDLPAKQRQVIVLPLNGASKAVSAEQAVMARHAVRLETLQAHIELAKAQSEETYAQAIQELRSATQAAFTEMSALRHATAVAKIPHVVAHVKAALEENDDGKLILFAHHHDVIAACEAALEAFQPAVLTGETSIPARQTAVDRFQTDSQCRLFIGSITAAGVGLTLTAASHVVFAELSWVPGEITQAEDRAHRISQQEMVLVQHLVYDGSLDATMAKRLVAKQHVLDMALDAAGQPDSVDKLTVPLVPLASEEPATAQLSRRQVMHEAEHLLPAEVMTVHAQLQYLAARCDGALDLDGAGFNRLDSRIGKSLAGAQTLSARQAVLGKKILRKYARQLRGCPA